MDVEVVLKVDRHVPAESRHRLTIQGPVGEALVGWHARGPGGPWKYAATSKSLRRRRRPCLVRHAAGDGGLVRMCAAGYRVTLHIAVVPEDLAVARVVDRVPTAGMTFPSARYAPHSAGCGATCVTPSN